MLNTIICLTDDYSMGTIAIKGQTHRRRAKIVARKRIADGRKSRMFALDLLPNLWQQNKNQGVR